MFYRVNYENCRNLKKPMEKKMRKKFLLVLMACFFILSFSITSFAESSLPEEKQTILGLYVTAKQAFEKWHSDQLKVKILDVRTQAEYIFVGHTPMAINIPSQFFKTEADSKKIQPVMSLNTNFVSDVKKRFKETDTILVICRSGSRSAAAVNLLANAGFEAIYSITDGFEGDALNVPGSYNNGKRIVNGWKNSGAPWTYKIDPELMYVP